MNIFFNVQSTGLSTKSSMISLGMYCESGESLYVEFIDFNSRQISSFIEKNIMEDTIEFSRDKKIINKFELTNKFPSMTRLVGDTNNMRYLVQEWIEKKERVSEEKIQFISDVGHYSFSYLLDFLFGNALDSKFYTYYDINQMISDAYNISTDEAFKIKRDDILKEESETELEWNALVKAEKMSKVYNVLKNKK